MKSSSVSHNGTKRRSSTAEKTGSHEGLRTLFEDQLKDIYWAEKALTKAIPKMIKRATSEELANALQDHLDVTESQVERVEEVFGIIGKTPKAVKCEAMEGLIKEADKLIEEHEEGHVRDAAIIAAAQKIEHYEIATYGTLCSFARTIGEDDAARILEDILNEEKDADNSLTEIAESSVNNETSEEEEE